MYCYRRLLQSVFLISVMASCVFLTLPAKSQQRAASVNSFTGEIVVVASSQALSPRAQFADMAGGGIPAILTYTGDVRVVASQQPTLPQSELADAVPDGYRIVTRPGSDATLTLPDDSRILIREMSILELNGFARDRLNRSSGMLMSLYAGSVRVRLAPGFQQQDAFFEIKTPNALVALHFSQPDVEVIYAPSPLENMTVLLEEGVELEDEEEILWRQVLAEREEDAYRRQREQPGGAAQIATVNQGTTALPVGVSQTGLQAELAQIGLIESEENILFQAGMLQRDEDRYAPALQPDVGLASATDGLGDLPGSAGGWLPMNLDLEQWQADGLITGDDDSGKGTTFVFVYTVSVSFMNRLTREARTIQPGQRAVLRGPGITMTMLNGGPMQDAPARNVGMTFALDSQARMPGLDKPNESSVLSQPGADPSTWLFPGASGRPELSGKRPTPHTVEIVIE